MIEKGVLRNAKEFEERPWGNFRVLHAEKILRVYKSIGPEDRVVKIISVKPKQRLSLQRHRQRAEEWHILSGKGTVTINGETIQVRPNQVIHIPMKAWHRITNISKKDNLVFIEITIGTFDEYDIERAEDDYQRDSDWKNK